MSVSFLQKDGGHASPCIGHGHIHICTTNRCHLGQVVVAHICWGCGPSVNDELVWYWSCSSLALGWSIQNLKWIVLLSNTDCLLNLTNVWNIPAVCGYFVLKYYDDLAVLYLHHQIGLLPNHLQVQEFLLFFLLEDSLVRVGCSSFVQVNVVPECSEVLWGYGETDGDSELYGISSLSVSAFRVLCLTCGISISQVRGGWNVPD